MDNLLYFVIIILVIALIYLYLIIDSNKKEIEFLKKNKWDYNSYFDSITEIAIISTDLNGIIKTFNRGAELLLGYEAAEMIDKETPLIFHDKEEMNKRGRYLSKKFHKNIKDFEIFVNYSNMGDSKIKRWTYIKKNGERICVELNLIHILDENSKVKGYIGIAKEIKNKILYEKKLKNDIKVLYKNLNEKKKLISTINSELRTITYNLSHSIKTPLHGINQISNWLMEDYKDSLNTDIVELLKLLNTRVEKLNGIIDSLLDYASIRIKKSSKIDLNELLTKILSSMEIPSTIDFIVPNNLPELKIDKEYITSVFTNIIDNSLKYMDKKHGIVEIGFVELSRQYMFYIKDNGPGIDEKYYDKIFTLFQSINESDTIEDLGVSLALTKKIIELHNGTIRIESKLGEGTTIFFSLPIENVS